MSMTYHGGIENITFEWGATNVPRKALSPDDVAQRAIADRMSRYAGALKPNGSTYDTGDMNDLLYPVRGGFEDWAYAGSWETQLSTTASPDTYGGYPPSKTQYDDATLRTFNFLVEISDNKDPPSNKYGTDHNLLSPPFAFDGNSDNGYASKNIRTALMAVDIVAPYVEITMFKKTTFDPEIRPLKQLRKVDEKLGNNQYPKKRKLGKSKPKPNKMVKWTVGGSITVDETFLLFGKYSNFPSAFGSVHQLHQSDIDEAIEMSAAATVAGGTDSDEANQQLLYVTEAQSGATRWTDPSSSEKEPKFSTELDLTPFAKGDKVAVFALAKVDQNWKEAPSYKNRETWPKQTSPQSHIVQGRTDENYASSKPNIGRAVRGRLHWISIPLTIVIK